MAGSTTRVLAIETSCDETAVAILNGRAVSASLIASQIDLHRPYGGVVPELASRNHNTALPPLIEKAMADAGDLELGQIDAFCATSGPGLASSLLIGNTFAKTLAVASNRPFFGVNHLEGHLLSPFLGSPLEKVPHHVGLVVSGGHTLLVEVFGFGQYRLLGTTRDDAAGEAFDKGAKMLGLPYPGGPEIDQLAVRGDPTAFDFPRSMLGHRSLDFSFSGLKTSLLYQLEKMSPEERQTVLPNLCASFQAAIVEVLTTKAVEACRETQNAHLAVSGGVSCNSALRSALKTACAKAGIALHLTPPAWTTDNAAMIGFVGALALEEGRDPSALEEDIDPNLPLAGLKPA